MSSAYTLIFMSARQSRGEASPLSLRTGMLGTLEVAGARGSEAEFNLVKRTVIMSVSHREIVAFLWATP